MELELGLAISTHGSIPWFDLNKEWFEPKGMEGTEGLSHGYPLHGQGCGYKRQKSDEKGVDIGLDKKVLPLVSWNEKPKEEDDGDLGKRSCQLVSYTKTIEDKNNYNKGWPPIQSWGKRFLPSYHQLDRYQTMNYHYRSLHNNPRRANESKSMYIKVKMEGVAIGRKINLRCYDSYESLLSSLITMFAKYTNNDEDNMMSNYTLKFQDREGNWLQARDASWQTLVEYVHRVEVQRNIYLNANE